MLIATGTQAGVLASMVLVMIMIPDGLFYGGIVRKKKPINFITRSFVAFAICGEYVR
ncbi:MAG: hypothetical protein WC406_07005 [Methanoregula sp.]|jgi:ammonia channel protein AmtB